MTSDPIGFVINRWYHNETSNTAASERANDYLEGLNEVLEVVRANGTLRAVHARDYEAKA